MDVVIVVGNHLVLGSTEDTVVIIIFLVVSIFNGIVHSIHGKS
jgi:hypothetical protein